MSKNKTVRSILLDFVEANGPQTWRNLQKVVLTVNGQPLNYHKYGSSYLDQVSKSSSVCFPTQTESRYLVRKEDGMYHIVNE